MPSFTVNRANFNAGTRNFGPYPVPVGLSRYSIFVDRNSWPDDGTEIVSIIIEFSLDGGVTWPFQHTGNTKGGDLVDPDGNPILSTEMKGPLLEPENAQRQARAILTTTRRINTAIRIEVT